MEKIFPYSNLIHFVHFGTYFETKIPKKIGRRKLSSYYGKKPNDTKGDKFLIIHYIKFYKIH